MLCFDLILEKGMVSPQAIWFREVEGEHVLKNQYQSVRVQA